MLATVVATEAFPQEPKLSQKPKGATVETSKVDIESTIRILSGEWSKAILRHEKDGGAQKILEKPAPQYRILWINSMRMISV